MTIEEKQLALIAAANAVTGGSDADITAAMQRLVDGYEQGGAQEIDGLIERTLGDSYTNSRVTSINSGCFSNSNGIKILRLPNVVTHAEAKVSFGSNTDLEEVYFDSFPLLPNQFAYKFQSCTSLKKAYFPKGRGLGNYVFRYCTALEKLWLGDDDTVYSSTPSILANTFQNNTILHTLILPGTNVMPLSSASGLSSTAIGTGTGYIYVPRSLVDEYKIATNWSNFAAQFRAIEDYPEVLENF